MFPSAGLKKVVEVLVPLRMAVLRSERQLCGINIEKARDEMLVVEESNGLSPVYQILVDSILGLLGNQV